MFIALWFLGGFAYASSALPFDEWLDRLTLATRDLGAAGWVVFALVSGLATVFFFPGSIFMTAAGAAFGLAGGFVTALLGASLGATLAFFVARYLARQRVERWIRAKPSFAAVDKAIGDEGWKIVLLTRCCPVFPYIFQNYAYGLTRVGFGHYALGSFLGLVPATLVFAYLGALARTSLDVAAGATPPLLDTILKASGFVATVLVSIYITRVARRALHDAGI